MTLAVHGGPPVRSSPLPSTSDRSGRRLGDEERKALDQVIDSGTLWRINGSQVPALEREFADYVGLSGGSCQTIASTSGTSAVHLAVAALRLEPGDEVIVPPITDFGTVAGVLAAGGIPVFADVEEDTGLLTAETIGSVLTSRTRAVIVVHLFGAAADGAAIRAACPPGVRLIEDCAQAYLSVGPDGAPVGTHGDIACFSLQQSKHITAGDGGLTVTDDSELASRMRLFADKGWPRDSGERTHLIFGLNYRMTELTAAVARAQLTKLSGVVADRRTAARICIDGIADCAGLRTVSSADIDRHAFWLLPLLIDEPITVSIADVAAALVAEGVPAAAGYLQQPLYSVPALAEPSTFGTSNLPFAAPYSDRAPGYRDVRCPNTEALVKRRLIVVQINENYTEQDARDIATAIQKVHCACLDGTLT